MICFKPLPSGLLQEREREGERGEEGERVRGGGRLGGGERKKARKGEREKRRERMCVGGEREEGGREMYHAHTNVIGAQTLTHI